MSLEKVSSTSKSSLKVYSVELKRVKRTNKRALSGSLKCMAVALLHFLPKHQLLLLREKLLPQRLPHLQKPAVSR
jgi:hypothetical protein